MDAEVLAGAALAFHKHLAEVKQTIGPDFPWYPYGSLFNFIHLKPILSDTALDTLVGGGTIMDIGAADGEVAFFLESLGHTVDIVDHAPTNFNGLRGARMLAAHLHSSIGINDVNLDSYFALPGQDYNLILFLGILYHLKNPFYVLERLAASARHLLLSTRVARFAPNGTPIRDISVAYLVGPAEMNGDATNFWIFSEAGLKQLLDRAGWDVVSFHTVGDTALSDPATTEHDERAFALLRSRNF